MILNTLTHGERFKIKATGETGLLIGLYGSGETLVVILDNHNRLTNRLAETEVERL